MKVPQIRNTLLCVLTIMIGGPLMGAYFAWQTGELHSFAQLGSALQHGAFGGFMMALGWIFFRSPFAGKITELLSAAKTVEPDGTVTEQAAKLTISEPEPETKPEAKP